MCISEHTFTFEKKGASGYACLKHVIMEGYGFYGPT